MSDEDSTRTRQDEIRAEIGKLVEEFATLKESEDCFITAWVVAYEATSIQLEQEEAALRGLMVPNHQIISASSGLGRFIQITYDPWRE